MCVPAGSELQLFNKTNRPFILPFFFFSIHWHDCLPFRKCISEFAQRNGIIMKMVGELNWILQMVFWMRSKDVPFNIELSLKGECLVRFHHNCSLAIIISAGQVGHEASRRLSSPTKFWINDRNELGWIDERTRKRMEQRNTRERANDESVRYAEILIVYKQWYNSNWTNK